MRRIWALMAFVVACGPSPIPSPDYAPYEQSAAKKKKQKPAVSTPPALVQAPELPPSMAGALTPANRSALRHSNGGQTWTVMVYMAADNNLEEFALLDLAEMAEGLKDSNLQIVVQIDRAAGFTEDTLGALGDFTDTKRIRVKSDAFELLEDMGETETGKPSTLSDFIVWGAETAPADRYALFLWNHGSGWPGFGGDDSVHGEDSELTLKELDAAIGDGRTRAQLPELAIIGFDACLMATLETARALEHHTELMLASEELEPGDGWDYRALSIFAKSPGADAVEIGKAIQQGFVTGRKLSDVTLSLTDTFHVAKVHDALDALGTAILKEDDETLTAVARAREQVASFVTGGSDFGDFARRVENLSQNLAAPARDLDAALRDAVVARLSGVVHSATTGLTVYFPPNANEYEEGYDGVEHMDGWRAFLKAYYALPALQPKPSVAIESVTVGDADLLGIRPVTAALAAGTGNGVVGASIATGIEVDGKTQILSVDPATISGDTISGLFSDISVRAVQGSSETYFFAELGNFDINAGTGVLRLPAKLNGDTLIVELSIEEWSVAHTRYYQQVAAGVGEVQLAAGDALAPEQILIDEAGEMTQQIGVPLTVTDELAFEIDYLPFGTTLTLFVIASSNNGDRITGSTTFEH